MPQVLYRVATPRPVVVVTGINRISYNPGDTFYGDTFNPSIMALESRHLVSRVTEVPVPTQPIPVESLQPIPGQGPPGPPGPTGPPGPPGVGSTTAHALATTGSPVIVDTAAPPTNGQVLTASSPTAASWQNAVGSGAGLPLTVVAKTTNYNLQASDSQKIFTNTGSSGLVNFTLPAWSIGLSYDITLTVSNTVSIIVPNTATLKVSNLTSSLGGNATASSAGCSLTVTALDTNLWIATSVTGTWVVA